MTITFTVTMLLVSGLILLANPSKPRSIALRPLGFALLAVGIARLFLVDIFHLDGNSTVEFVLTGVMAFAFGVGTWNVMQVIKNRAKGEHR